MSIYTECISTFLPTMSDWNLAIIALWADKNNGVSLYTILLLTVELDYNIKLQLRFSSVLMEIGQYFSHYLIAHSSAYFFLIKGHLTESNLNESLTTFYLR